MECHRRVLPEPDDEFRKCAGRIGRRAFSAPTGHGPAKERTDANNKIRAHARREEDVMSKRVLIGLFALGVVAFLWTEAHAGCAVIAGFQVCADWITGGSAASVLTVEGPAGQVDTTSQACGVTTTQGPPETTGLLALTTP